MRENNATRVNRHYVRAIIGFCFPLYSLTVPPKLSTKFYSAAHSDNDLRSRASFFSFFRCVSARDSFCVTMRLLYRPASYTANSLSIFALHVARIFHVIELTCCIFTSQTSIVQTTNVCRQTIVVQWTQKTPTNFNDSTFLFSNRQKRGAQKFIRNRREP